MVNTEIFATQICYYFCTQITYILTSSRIIFLDNSTAWHNVSVMRAKVCKFACSQHSFFSLCCYVKIVIICGKMAGGVGINIPDLIRFSSFMRYEVAKRPQILCYKLLQSLHEL